MQIQIASSNTTVKVTQRDLIAFEQRLINAAHQQNQVEVNVKNAQRGYILFTNWHPDYNDETAERFASGMISLVLDGVDNIAIL